MIWIPRRARPSFIVAAAVALSALAMPARADSAGGSGVPRYKLPVSEIRPPLDCRGDVDFAASFLLANDAGLRAHGWSAYPPPVAKRLSEQRIAAAKATSAGACADVLQGFFRSIRKGHLAVRPVEVQAQPEAPSSKPADGAKAEPGPRVELRPLSSRTVYLRVPSFDLGIREQLEQLIERNQAQIRNSANLIVDVRNNGGGSDSSFGPLLELLGPATYRVPGADVLVTAATLSGWKASLREIPASEPKVRRSVNEIIARMTLVKKEADRRGRSEAWAPLSTDRQPGVTIGGQDVKARPERVWVMIDSSCASSCEQFVLMARQNRRVTLVGRRTFGALDASNLRPVRTPSGAIEVWFATTYVRRPRGQEVDEVGIAPTVSLPLPPDEAAFAAEVGKVQAMAERLTN